MKMTQRVSTGCCIPNLCMAKLLGIVEELNLVMSHLCFLFEAVSGACCSLTFVMPSLGKCYLAQAKTGHGAINLQYRELWSKSSLVPNPLLFCRLDVTFMVYSILSFLLKVSWKDPDAHMLFMNSKNFINKWDKFMGRMGLGREHEGWRGSNFNKLGKIGKIYVATSYYGKSG